MNATARRTRFRQLLEGPACIRPGSVFDPISARIAADLGFEVGMLAGSVASMSVLGAPDLIVLTLTELAEQVRRICRAADLPLMVDADHGYGNALNVMRTVEELENAGLSGLSIEDTDLPPPFGAGSGSRLLSVEEGIGKMKAAVAARSDPALVVFGRTSAPAIAGIDETLRRCRAYAGTGVDGIFVVGMKTREELDALAEAVDLPLMLGSTPPALADDAYLASRGVRVALSGHAPYMAAIRAVRDTLKALREGVAPGELEGLPEPELVRRVTRRDDYDRAMREFLGG